MRPSLSWARSRSPAAPVQRTPRAVTSRCTLCTPFFPARQTGLPDIVGEVQSRVAELVFDGTEFLGFGDIDGPLDHLPQNLLGFGPQLFHQDFNLFFPRRDRVGSHLETRHGKPPGPRGPVRIYHRSVKTTPGRRISHPSNSCTPPQQRSMGLYLLW